uniref:protein-tyrosine-phosphatase n=1 Tax=Coturnix japonica TaxID=93934 RepID=A0A8C2T537_COTJA
SHPPPPIPPSHLASPTFIHSLSPLCSNKFLIRRIHSLPEGAVFKKPQRPGQRSRVQAMGADMGKENVVQRPSSAPDLMENVPDGESPVVLRRCSLTSCMGDEEDDGFMEILDEEEMKVGGEGPTAPPWQPPMRSKCRQLFRSPSMPSSVIRPILKRIERPHNDSPVQSKRRRSVTGTPGEGEGTEKGRLLRSRSLCQEQLENMLDTDRPELIGDFSKGGGTVEGKHQDLKYISPEMVTGGSSSSSSSSPPCRALSTLPMEQDVEFLLKEPIVPLNASKRVILIFHCEVSSERGQDGGLGGLWKDRACNQARSCTYPELYVLKGGYREFFPQYQAHCEPQSYRPMHHADFKEDLRMCRMKSRTWAGERSKRELYSRVNRC